MTSIEATAEQDLPEGQHVAVVHFHGMGEQRRYEEVSRLIDSLDVHSHRSREAGDSSVGTLQKIRARLEAGHDERMQDVVYVNVTQSVEADSGLKYSTTRFYEAYWASMTAAGSKPMEVLIWLLKRLPTPFRMLASHWRSHHRIRRAALHSLHRTGHDLDWASEADFRRLLHEYDRFERPPARRKYPAGKFDEFIAFLKSEYSGNRQPGGERLIRLAQRWRWAFVGHELVVLFIFTCFLLLVGWGLIALLGLVMLILNQLEMSGLSAFLGSQGLEAAAERVKPSYGTAFVVLTTLATSFGASRWVGGYLGDVQYWSTFRETDEKFETRRKILDCGTALLAHVLNDPQCSRVVITAHSLGTAIAMECLLELGRHNRARHRAAPMLKPLPLEKISHFVTMGSPIDKIHYFFESHSAQFHRYVRIFDEIRGDIGEVPFAKNRKPHIHWINIWDKADIVSGPLDSPTNAQLTQLQVDNVEVSSYPFPAPAASHSAYFGEPGVIGLLYRVIFLGAHNFLDAPRDENGKPNLDAMIVGPGAGKPWVRWIQVAFLLSPLWFILLLAAGMLSLHVGYAYFALGMMLLTGGAIGGGLALNDWKKSRFY